MSIAEMLLTVDEFLRAPEREGTELVRGKVVEMTPPPRQRRGKIVFHIGALLTEHNRKNPVGHVTGAESAVFIDAHTLRGADVAFFSFERVPRQAPRDYWRVAPEVVFEVLSPNDRWAEMHEKIGDYLKAGVLAVVVLEDELRCAQVFQADARPQAYLSPLRSKASRPPSPS